MKIVQRGGTCQHFEKLVDNSHVVYMVTVVTPWPPHPTLSLRSVAIISYC